MTMRLVAGLVGLLSLMVTVPAQADAIALPEPTIAEIRAPHEGEYTVINPRNLLMLYFAARDGGLHGGQLTIPRITDLDKQKADASLARYSIWAGRIGIDDDDPVRPVRKAADAGDPYKDSFEKRAVLQDVIDYYNTEADAMNASRKLLIRTRLELSEYDFAKQQYRLEVGKGLVCAPMEDKNTRINHNFCLKTPALSGLNSSPFRLLKISEAQARDTVAKIRPSYVVVIAECDTRHLALNGSAGAKYNQNHSQIDVGECAINRIHVASLKSEGRKDYYQVVATFDLEGKAQRSAPAIPSRAVIAPESGLKKAAPRQQQTLDLSK